MTISDERLDALFAAANPLPDNMAGQLPLDDEYNDLFAFVSAAPRRRHSLAVVVAAASAVLVSGGVAAAAWHGSDTGIVAHEGTVGSSDLLDTSGDDFVELAHDATRAIPFPPGDDADAYIRAALPPGSGLMSVNGVRVTLSYDAQCAWQGYWLQAFDDGDAAALDTSTTVLQQIPTWPWLAASDSSGVIDQARTVAAAAAAERDDPVRQVWSANCTELPRHWAHS